LKTVKPITPCFGCVTGLWHNRSGKGKDMAEERSLKEMSALLEAVLFAAGEPVSVARLAEVLEESKKNIEMMLSAMQESYDLAEDRGIRLLILDDKAQLASKPAYGETVLKVLEARRSPTLSPSALEVLSVAAYRQPVTRGVIEQIRGVDSSYTVASLLEKGILEECGRLDVPGRPILYRTTDAFLRIFGLNSLEDLPPLPDELDDRQLTMLETPITGGEED